MAFIWSPFGSNTDVSLNDRFLPPDYILFIGNKRITSFSGGIFFIPSIKSALMSVWAHEIQLPALSESSHSAWFCIILDIYDEWIVACD
jgi:hypothetical protein